MTKTVRSVYESYDGEGSFHLRRLLCAAIISGFIGFFGFEIEKSAYPIIALSISVLGGFAFSALFSSHSITVSDLPSPKDESDRNDIKILIKLGDHIRCRSKLFIIIVVFDLLLILLTSIRVTIPEWISASAIYKDALIPSRDSSSATESILGLAYIVIGTAKSIAVFIFFESLYTFYRLAETMMSVVDMRRVFIEARREAE